MSSGKNAITTLCLALVVTAAGLPGKGKQQPPSTGIEQSQAKSGAQRAPSAGPGGARVDSASLITAPASPLRQGVSAPQRLRALSRQTHRYLVPPPPAYMPSILPELYTRAQEARKPRHPYRKYIYTREGYEEPPPVKTNKYVTYWNGSQGPTTKAD